MATKPKEKKKTMDLIDLRNGAKAIIKVKGEIEISKYVSWDNTDGKRGVIKTSFLFLNIREMKDEEVIKEARFPIGYSEVTHNIWIGKEIAKRERAGATEIAL